jgi:SAM-dependent MidA family methyltransferase
MTDPAANPNPLQERLVRLITDEGPLNMAQYMMLCLHDPRHGYYATRPSLGAEGDFVTAPEVSQMFGEMVGLWLMESWNRLGRPVPFRLVEIGPGSGALMSDILRTGRALPGFLEAADLWLVEASAPLRALQAERLAEHHPQFADRLEDVPPGAPVLLAANEYLDCLPARQFVHRGGEWFEQRVGLDPDGALALGLSPLPSGLTPPADAPDGAVWELSVAQSTAGNVIGERIASEGGVALLIDYGRDTPDFGDTLQALKRHRKQHPLAEPGQADLTVHVDFPAVAAGAKEGGAAASSIVSQSDFLRGMGIETRAQRLMQNSPDSAPLIQRQLQRLINPSEMGLLFKVLAIHRKDQSPLGFEPDPA